MNNFSTVTPRTGEPRISRALLDAEPGDPGRQSTWFGSQSRPLLGSIHVPDGCTARGAVVLCPPLGKEQIDSYRALALMAQKLCAAGLLVLRFDYAGTGDSAGDQDEKQIVEQWQDSVVSAVDFVRACGVEDVALVGLRVGALLAASVADRCGPLTALAFWDPVVSGRAYLREQRALYSVSVVHDDEADPRVSIIGALFDAEVATEFSRLDASKLPSLGCPVLVATREERSDSRPVRTLVANQGADEHRVVDHDLFLEDPGWDVMIPRGDIDAISTWVDAAFRSASTSVVVPIRRSALIPTPSGDVLESIEAFGPAGLFAIRTTATEAVQNGPAVVFYATAFEHRIGPARLWVEMARNLAVHGVSSIRFDRRGVGESGDVDDEDSPRLYSVQGDEDAVAAVHAAGTDPKNVVVAGLCSGGVYAGYAAQRTEVNAAVLINLREWTTRRVDFTKRAMIEQQSPSLTSRAKDRLHTLGVRVKDRSQERMPYRLWLWLGKRGLIQVPEILLRELHESKVRTTVVLGPEDRDWFDANRGPEGMRRLRSRATSATVPQIRAYAGGDHTLYGRDFRETVRWELTSAIASALKLEIEAPVPPVVVDWTPL